MKEASIKRNFMMNIILTMSSFIFPLITFPYVSRVLLPVGTGKIAFATSIVTYFNMFAQLGIPTYGIRACAKVRDNKLELTRVTHELLLINIITSAISYLLLVIAILLIPKFYQEKTLIVIISLTIILNAFGMEWLYRGLELYSYITIRSLIFKIIAVIGMFVLVHKESDYIIYGAITIFAASASNILNFINSRKYIFLKPVGEYSLTKHLKIVLVFFAMSCATTVYTNLDTVMLGLMTTDADVGFYNAAVKIKLLLVSVVTSLGTVLLPRASYYIEHNKLEEFKSISKKAMHFVVLLSTPLVVYFIVFAREGIVFLSGDAFNDATIPMRIIMPTVFLIGITNILGIQMLVPLGKEKVVLRSEIAGACVDFILNLLLIPSLKSAGATIGTLAAELVVLIVQACELQEEIRSFAKSFNWVRVCIASVVSLCLSIGIKYLNLGCFLTLVLSSFVFFGAYLALMITQRDEIVLSAYEQILIKLKGNVK